MSATRTQWLLVLFAVALVLAYENVLVREDGRWKFQYLHAYQTF